jgi:hypothetical protein
VLWNKRWKPKLLKHLRFVSDLRTKSVAKKKERKAAKIFEEIAARYNGILTLLRDIDEYGKEGTGVYERFRSTVFLEDRLRYDPHMGTVFFGKETVAKPRVQSQEWLVWKMLHESRTIPRSVSYELLQGYTLPGGRRIFSKIGDRITIQLSQWNRKFRKFAVAPLHKQGRSIVLSIEGKPKSRRSLVSP